MRTTINLDQDVLEVARSVAVFQGISMGAAVSALARCGISGAVNGQHNPGSENSRFPAFTVAEQAPRFGTEEVRRALDDE